MTETNDSSAKSWDRSSENRQAITGAARWQDNEQWMNSVSNGGQQPSADNYLPQVAVGGNSAGGESANTSAINESTGASSPYSQIFQALQGIEKTLQTDETEISQMINNISAGVQGDENSMNLGSTAGGSAANGDNSSSSQGGNEVATAGNGLTGTGAGTDQSAGGTSSGNNEVTTPGSSTTGSGANNNDVTTTESSTTGSGANNNEVANTVSSPTGINGSEIASTGDTSGTTSSDGTQSANNSDGSSATANNSNLTTSDNPTTTSAPNDSTTPTATSNPATAISAPAGAQPGTYNVVGDQIIGPNGQPFIMTGINDNESTEHDELTGDMAQLKAEGANTVRLTGTAADLEGGPNNAFNQEVQAALNAGLYVDIGDGSDETKYGGTGAIYSAADTAEAAQALEASAAEWGNNPNVGWNVANEQGASGDANNPTLLSSTETLLQAVDAGAQSVNPGANPLKFVDDSTWGQGAFSSNLSSDSFLDQNVAALEAAGDGNVVGAVHDYESTPGQYNTSGVNAIQEQGMPVIAEEVGVQDPAVAADSLNMLSQIQTTTGEPIGGLVWMDGTQPDGTSYANVMTTSEAQPIENFWQTVDSEAASATPVAG